MKPEVEIYDTTLRDGSQGEGIHFSVRDKLRIALKLDAFGVDYIEGGWPGSNQKDVEFFKMAKTKAWKHAKICAFGSTRKKNVRIEDDPQVRLLLEAETPVVTIFGKSSLLHVEEVLRTTQEENLAMISETIQYLKSHGKIVIFDAEHAFDGYKHNPGYALLVWKVAGEAGADVLVFCDTNGGSLPWDIGTTLIDARAVFKGKIGIHTHNDGGLADANSIVAVQAGATHVQGTINGYGERTGNSNLVTVIPNLALKMDHNFVSRPSLSTLREVSMFVDEVANIRHNKQQPWVGGSAFAHKGGTHVNAVEKLVASYEHVDPATVGNSRRILVGDLSGQSNIILKAHELGFQMSKDTKELPLILNELKRLESQGYVFEAAEGSLALLIQRFLKHELSPFLVPSYHVSMRNSGNNPVCDAVVKVQVGDQIAHHVAEGDGPINALDIALKLALSKFFPQLEGVHLVDFKVRIIDGGKGTGAKTRVFIQSTDGKREWATVGVNENIVEASLEALIDAMTYPLMTQSM